MNSSRFFVMLFQVGVILKTYDLWNNITGLGFRTYLIFIVAAILLICSLFGQYGMGRSVPSILPFKFPKYFKSSKTAVDMLFIATGMTVFAFVYGHFLTNFQIWIGMICSIILANFITSTKSPEFRWAAFAIAAGFFLASPYSGSVLFYVFLLFGNFFIYLTSEPGQF